MTSFRLRFPGAAIVLVSALFATTSVLAQETPAAPAAPAATPSAPAAAAAPAATAEKTADPDTEETVSDDELSAQGKESNDLARDLSPVLKPIYDVGDDDGKRAAIKVDAWVNRKNLTYVVGDSLAVFVRPKSDAYITILNVGSSGRIAVIYPNHYQRDAKVRGGTTVRIPGRKGKWVIAVGEPAGVDLIKVIASKKPLTLKELQSIAATDESNPIISVGRSADETTRDLTAQMKPEADDDVKDPKFGVRNILVRVKAD